MEWGASPLNVTEDVPVILNITEPDSIQTKLYNIYDWMMMHDELMMNSRSDIRELDTEITGLMSTFNALFQ